MLPRFPVYVLALLLSACSPGSSSQPAPQSQNPQTPPQQSTPPASSAVERATPVTASAGAANPASETSQKAAPASTASPAETATRATEKGAVEPTPTERAEPSKPAFREVTVPAGTVLQVRLITPIASDTSAVEDSVRGSLTQPIVVDGITAVPAGTEVTGTIRDAKRSGRVKGRASVAFRFERLHVRDESVAIRTALVSRQAAANRRDDVEKGAIGGAAGAVVGGILGGGKGAAIGAGVGATGAVVATRGDEVRLEAGSTVRATLQQQFKVIVPLR